MQLLFIILFTIYSIAQTTTPAATNVKCSKHCALSNTDKTKGNGPCFTDGTCLYGCVTGTGYEAYDSNDKSCTNCKTSTQTEMYIKDTIKDECIKSTTTYSRANKFIPENTNSLIDIFNEKETKDNQKLNKDSSVGSGPCPFSQQYRIGKWYKLTTTNTEEKKNIVVKIETNGNQQVDVYLDLAIPFAADEKEGKCLGRIVLRKGSKSAELIYPYKKQENGISYYLYVSIDGVAEVDYKLTFNINDSVSNASTNSLQITQNDINALATGAQSWKTYDLKFSSEAPYMESTCIDGMIVKGLSVKVSFESGDYLLRFDTLSSSRINMVELTNEARDYCYEFYDGKLSTIQNIAEADRKYGVTLTTENNAKFSETYKNQYKVDFNFTTIDGKKYKNYLFMTEETDVDIKLNVSVICRKYCNEGLESSTSPGHCDKATGECICATERGFGGSDCHQMCYFNNSWQGNYKTNHADVCKFGSKNCDELCKCEKGYALNPSTNECISEECSKGSMNSAKGDQCVKGSRGCLSNCKCDSANKWNSNNGTCKHSLCGNSVIDEYKNTDGSQIKEQCDKGFNCNHETCLCNEGYEPDPKDPKSCKKPEFPVWGIVLIAVGAVVILVVFIIIFAIIIISIFRIKKVDLNEFKKQQSVYYYYIHGSSSVPPGKDNRYSVEPTELEFGNDQQATNIHETRFEKMIIRNYSKKKHMMIIFHTPNNPKFVFHFEPQVVFLRPRTNQSESVLYMTLHCTTKIREMKIPYTVWWSKSKAVLEEISDILKDKTFEDWSTENKESMERLCKSVTKHIHYNLTIMTDAVTSTHIDMDEINMVEKPIAEGAMGKVFVGTYRSVTVAVKQFRWENLLPEEVEDLKTEVMAECEIMAKLRNPFIANYMGSVTYIPQISMVMQFFVMGSLGEYLRKEKEDYLKMSYRLKIRILFDTARGMQFLHENSIMHLDLKPDNLLVNSLFADAACCVKITDFGTSRLSKKTAKTGDKGLGTPIYLAPEGYKDEYTNGGDVFAYAVSAWELFYQEEPYKDFKSLFEIKNYVESGKRLEIDETMPPMLKNLIEECWQQQSSSRPSFEQICKKLNKIEEDAVNHVDLDADVSEERVQQLMTDRAERLNKMLNDLVHE